VDSATHLTQQKIFYNNPLTYLSTQFPSPPSLPFGSTPSKRFNPSHILLFGELLSRTEEGQDGTVGNKLREKGFVEIAKLWNGFDWAQDEVERRGGVRVWVKRDVDLVGHQN